MLGEVEQQNNEWANIKIKGILEADSDEENLFYQEKTGEVAPNLNNIKKWVKSIQDIVPDYNNFNFVGDIHTHPIKADNRLDKNVSPTTPSDEDVKDIIGEYENGNLSFAQPFIFGIAGRRNIEENTSYAFYRLIKRDDKYILVQIEKK